MAWCKLIIPPVFAPSGRGTRRVKVTEPMAVDDVMPEGWRERDVIECDKCEYFLRNLSGTACSTEVTKEVFPEVRRQ